MVNKNLKSKKKEEGFWEDPPSCVRVREFDQDIRLILNGTNLNNEFLFTLFTELKGRKTEQCNQ